MRIFIKIAAILLGIIIIFYLASSSGMTYDEFLKRAASLKWHHIVLFFTCYFLIFLVSGIRWKLISSDIEPGLKDVPIRYFFRYVAFGALSGFFVPSAIGDFGVRSAALRYGKKVSFTKGSLSLVLDMFFSFAVGFVVLVPAVLFLAKKITMPQALGSTALIAAVFFILIKVWAQGVEEFIILAYRMLISIAYRAPFLKKIFINAPKIDQKIFLKEQTYPRIFILGFLKYILMAAAVFVISSSLNLSIGYFFYFLSFSVVLFMVAIPLIPGGLGILELGWYGLLTGYCQIDPYLAVSFSLIYRLFLIASSILLAALSLIFK